MTARSSRALPIAWIVVNAALGGALVALVLIAFYGQDDVRVPVEVQAQGLELPARVSVGAWLDGEAIHRGPDDGRGRARCDRGDRPAAHRRGRAVAATRPPPTRRGDPFETASVRRLRLMGGVLVLGGLAVEMVDTLAWQELWERLPPSEGELGVAGFALPVEVLYAGLLAYAWPRSSPAESSSARTWRPPSSAAGRGGAAHSRPPRPLRAGRLPPCAIPGRGRS